MSREMISRSTCSPMSLLTTPLPRAARHLSTLAVVAMLLSLTSPAHAHRSWRAMRTAADATDPEVNNIKYDGRFTFARIRYTTGPGGYYYRGLPAWAHGYPVAEQNLMRIMREVTILRSHVDEGNVFALDDPELMRYPVAYMPEAGFWTMTDREAAGLRAYLLKGGFVIFDDFRDDLRSAGWENFTTNMLRVLPWARFVDLSPTHPIFHSFFDVSSFDSLPQYYDVGRPVFRGI